MRLRCVAGEEIHVSALKNCERKQSSTQSCVRKKLFEFVSHLMKRLVSKRSFAGAEDRRIIFHVLWELLWSL